MGPEQLRAVAAFARVAQHASFSKAAATLGVSPSALSQTIRALEDRVGIRLLNRTTRRVGVTEAGALFLQRVLPALDQFTAAFTELDELRGTPTGTLRVSLPRMAMTTIVVPLLRDFCGAYPQIRLDLIADDRFVDLIGEGFDAGILLGERLGQDMIAE
jgi:DNA-binding transcriptional LysR family regulator